jgi:hypothetical protein
MLDAKKCQFGVGEGDAIRGGLDASEKVSIIFEYCFFFVLRRRRKGQYR